MEEIYKNLDLNNLEGEEWRDIEGYEGKYQVSSYGRVKSLKFGKDKILRQGKLKNGYLVVTLCKDNKVKTFLVHRLVGNAFLENKNNLPCFNHKNEIKTDNRAENLEPCTQKYNVNYKNSQARRVASTDWKEVAEKLSRQVYQYDKNGELVAILESTQECKRNGYNQGAVAACCRGELKYYKNFIWSYTPLDSK